ncbi:MAG: HD-GYP domain-containing protein [Thermodesulfobacteriota bacterium]
MDAQSGLFDADDFFPVSPDTLKTDTRTDFPVYLKRGGRYVLYTKARKYFSRNLKDRLVQNGIDTVYIPLQQQASYETYVMENLEEILNNPEISAEVRSKVFLNTTANRVKEIFHSQVPTVDEQMLGGVENLVNSSLSFLLTPEAMENIGRFLSHDYQTFSHSVHVFTYAMMLMNDISGQWEKQTLVDAGVGALLHDIGKIRIPASILNKPGKLDEKEWEQIKLHPECGTSMCTNVYLPRTSLACIGFHHEKFDGSGYPSGIKGEKIPVPVRVVTCCDVYDAITSNRPYAPAKSPFEALQIMSKEMHGAFDPGILKAFIHVLGRMNQ